MKRAFSQYFGSIPFAILRVTAVLLLVLVQVVAQPAQGAVAAPAEDVAEPQPVVPAPLQVATPDLTLTIPSTEMVGAAFSFTATFDNTGAPPNEVGYGPFIDLVFPATGEDGATGGVLTPPNDGITFVSASYLGAVIPSDQVFVQTFPDADGAGPGTTGCVQHPIAVRPANDPPPPANPSLPRYYQVCGNAGDQFVTIVLPFGSFVPAQPAATVTINAQMSNLADLGTPLGITGQAGFRFGYTPTSDFCCSPFDASLPVEPGGVYDTTNTTAFPRQNVTPELMTLSKLFTGEENETATGPNFPKQFVINIDVADGQTITDMVITDNLAPNIQFVSLDSVSPAASSTSLPSTSSPGGTLSATIASVTGGAGAVDASLRFTFIIDRAVSGTPVIDPTTGVFAGSANTADVVGDWNPIDPRDTDSSPTATCGVPCVGIQDQSFAIQKSVSNTTDGSNSPGDVLEYTLNFQVSDFFGFQNLNLTDTFTDGQRFDSSYAPQLTLNGNPNNVAGVMAAGNVDVTCNYTGGPGPECDSDNPAANTGETTVVFNLSDELSARFSNPQLLGGCVNPSTDNAPPVCSGTGSYNNGPTTGTITFRTIIQDQFTDLHLAPGNSGDSSVDHGDVLGNAVNISGSVLNISIPPVGGQFSTTGQPPVIDDSGAGVNIAFGGLVKSIYAVNGSTSIPEYLSPLDVVTYRFTYTQPASDFEETTLTDYLPLPVYDATELTTLDNSICGIPAAGVICLGSTDTYHNLNSRGENLAPAVPPGHTVVTPTFATDGAANTLTITYPEYDSVYNISSKVDILFSVTVTNDPFADGLFLTNQANSAEGTTNAGDQALDAIVQIKLGEPVLRIGKTAVSTDHLPAADITFQPDVSALMSRFTAPGVAAGVPFSGTISTNDLSSAPNNPAAAFDLFNSTMNGPDNQDLVKYAIVIENKGHSPDGAYDIAISDILPADMLVPTAGPGLNLQLYTGNRNPLTFTSLATSAMCTGSWPGNPCGPNDTAGDADDIFGAGIRVDDPAGVNVPGACQVHSLTSGANIVVITYDLLLGSGSSANNTIINTASLQGYGGSEGGPNHLTEPLDDEAELITAGVQVAKALTGTEFNVTGNNAADQAAIGEIVTYTLTTKFFELNTLGAQIVDTLDPGLAFVDLVSVRASNPDTDGAGADTGLSSSVMNFNNGSVVPADLGLCTNCAAGTNPTVGVNGSMLTFNFGNVSNTDIDNTVAETVTIVYRAVVLNVSGNQTGTLLNNSAELTWTGAPAPLVVTAPNVTVVEPAVTIVKGASASAALDAGDPLSYNFTITGATTDAYDVTFSDPLPLYFTPDSLPGGSFTATKNPGALDVAPQFELVGSGPYTFQTKSTANLDLAPGESIAITINGTISYAAPANATLTNTATTRWTSLNGDFTTTGRSTYDTTDSKERTGADGVGGALNDYAALSTVVTSVTNPLVLTKTLVSTSEGHTTVPTDVAIGEIARFRLVVEVPEGTNNDLLFEDTLPRGLTFLNDGTARAAFVCNGPSPCATSTPPSLGMPFLPGAGWIMSGASGAVTPTYVLLDDNVSASRSLNDDVYSSGTQVVFKFGSLVNNDNDPDKEYAVVEFNALVDNDYDAVFGSNDNGDPLANTFQAIVNGAQSGNTGGPVTLTVREPLINNVDKHLTAPIPTSFDAGDTVSFTVTYSNTGSTDAFNVVLSDSLHSALDLVSVSAPTYNAACSSPPHTDNSNLGAGNNVSVTVDRVRVGCQVSLVYTANILYTVTPQQIITNTATVNYTSLPGAYGTTDLLVNLTGSALNALPAGYDTVAGGREGERNHDTGQTGGTNNDYTDDDNQDITIDNASLVKTIVSTTEAGTSEVASPRPLMIGEVARYRLVMTIPEGVTNTLSFLDNIPLDMQYLDDGTAALAFVSDTGATCNITSNDADLTGGTLCIVGNETSIPAPTFLLPAAQLANETSAGNPFLSGHDARISLGTVTNNDDDANDELVVFEFNARVLNTTTSDRGDPLTNSANAYTGATSLASSSINAIIVEPVVTIAKARAGTQVDAGDQYTYTLTVTASSAANTTTAYDLIVTDTLPYTVNNAVIDLVSVSSAAPGGVVVTDTSTYNVSPNPDVVSATIDQLAPGQSVVLTITVKILDRWPVGRRIDNVGSVTWTSLPADGSPNERNSTPASNPPNDYSTSSASNQVTPSANPLIDKRVLSDTTYTIGEDVTYDIVVTLPEGITRNLRIQDVLPTGLSYQSHSLVTTAAASGGLLTLDYLGTPAISTSPAVGATGTILFTFGDTTNPSDSPNNNATANNAFLLRVTARVDNIASNVDGTVRLNTASLLYYRGTTSTDTTVTDTTNNTNLTIVEPRITTDKTVTAPVGNVQAGDVVSYTARFTNTGNSTAFEVTALDTLAQGVTYNTGSAACSYFNGTTTAPIAVSVVDGGTTLVFDGNPAGSWDIPATAPDSYVECNYTVTAQNTLILDGTKLNTIDADWSSMPGTSTGERIYNDGTVYPFDGTQDTDTATFPTIAPDIQKDDGGVTQTVIGDVIHFTLTITSPLGTLSNAEVVDHLPAGLIYVASSQTVSAGVNVPTFTPTGPVDGSGPVTLTWDFGVGAVVTASPFTIEYDAIVANVGTNQNLTVLLNAVDLNYNNAAGTPRTDSDNEQSTINEPDLDITKDAAAIAVNPDAGDTVTYTITIFHNAANSTATAYDVHFEDTLPAYADLDHTSALVTSVVVSGAGAATVTNNSNNATNTVDVTISDIPLANTVTITYEATLTSAVTPGQLIQNTGDVYWTSQPGDNNPGDVDGERDGDGTNPPNDYHASDTGDLIAAAAQPEKSILATSETHTGEALPNSADVAIGEVLRYRLAVQLPEGTSNDFIITDQLAVNGGTALITPILDNTMQITAVNFSAGNFDSLNFGVPLENARIAPVSLYDAGGTAQFTAPFNLVTLSAGNLLTFNLGDIVNNDLNDGNTEYIYIEFNVLVNNVSDNTLGDILANNFNISINGGAPVLSNTVNARVVEPSLSITKVDDDVDGRWVYGQTPVTYTIQVAHTGASTATAFEIAVTDVIPTGLTYLSTGVLPANWTSSYTPATRTLTWNCSPPACSMPQPGAALNLTYQVTVNDQYTTPHLSGNDTAVNTANLTWTSLPGTGTTSNPTGSNTPGGSGASNGERNGTSANPPNSYAGSATHTGQMIEYYSLGNRVWFDTNNNGTMDAGEQPVGNVLVQLYSASDLNTVLASDVTTAGGYYMFDYLLPGDYVVAIAADNFDTAGTYNALVGYWSSGTSRNGVGAISETPSPALDADTVPTDADDNGALTGAVPLAGAVVTQAVTLGPSGLTEPLNEVAGQLESGVLGNQGAQPDGRANMTVDFGFYKVAIGNLVYEDVNNNGTYDAGETLLNNVPVDLLSSNGTLITSTTTNPSGVYSFANLPEGDYIVRVTTPAGMVSTIDSFNSADNGEPDNELDDNDNGIGIGFDTRVNVSSGTLTMDAGEAGGTIAVSDGITTDTGVDFGFVYAYALGNRVWFDTNNSAVIDDDGAGGNPDEVGADGVVVALYHADAAGNPTTAVTVGGVALTDTTVSGGYYLFDYLNPGNYVVVIPNTNFAAGAVLEGYWSSSTSRQIVPPFGIIETAAPSPENNTDSDDNGTRNLAAGVFPVGAVPSLFVTLGAPGEPTGETDLEGGVGHGDQPNNRSNLTVDFGFYQVVIGNQVWMDTDKDGYYDNGTETPISGATVRLYAANGTTLVASTVTDGNALGNYRFPSLPASNYILSVTVPSGASSTIDSYDQNDNNSPNINTDHNDNGIGTGEGEVFSNILTMTPGQGTGGSAGKANNTVTQASGTTTDTTVDFGYITAYALGNRVWFDTDNNGAMDAGEQPVGNVLVQLYSASDLNTVLASDVTTAGGYYLFDYLDAGDYVVAIAADNFTDTGVLDTYKALVGYWSSGTQRSIAGAISETPSPALDADTVPTDADDNGALESVAPLNGAVVAQAVTLGAPGEPTGEVAAQLEPIVGQGAQPDNRANMTVDFGFYKVAIGNLVYEDVNNNGTYDAGDNLLNNVPVELLSSNGTLITSTTTNASGVYSFTDLPEGDYIVRVTMPSGMVSTIDSFNQPDTTSPNQRVDNNDNGLGSGYDTRVNATSGALTMKGGLVAATVTVTQATGTTTDTGLDFGFVYAYALGNRVWFDTNNGTTIDSGVEAGVNGVVVALYHADAAGNPTTAVTVGGVALTDTTASGGYYLFDYLNPGNYVVVIPVSNFAAGAVLDGYWSSSTSRQIVAPFGIVETAAPSPENNTDSDDNGTRNLVVGVFPANAVPSQAVTLGGGTPEPTSEGDLNGGSQGAQPDNRANMTVDFGFYKVAIGNLVFNDLNKNGTFDGADTPINAATVRLYAANGSTLVSSTTTNALGNYLFPGLPESKYIISVTVPSGASSTIDTYDLADNNSPDVNTDNNDNGVGTGEGEVFSNVLTMTPGQGTGGSAGKANNTVTQASGTTTDTTVDFGYVTAYAVGNRVWFDTNNNHQIDGGEVGVNGVTVELYNADGVTGNITTSTGQVATTTNGGYYLFDYLDAGKYIVVVQDSNFGPGKPLEGYWSSDTRMTAAGASTESPAPSPDNDLDIDDNGTRNNTAGILPVGAVPSLAVTLGGAPEPTSEGDLNGGSQGAQPDNRANMTVDFGFYKTEIGNLVYEDVNANGNYEAGTDTPIDGATVRLYDSTGTNEILVGPDGILGAGVDAAGGVTTGGAFGAGQYKFSGLPDGDYIIKVTGPAGMISTRDDFDAADNANPDVNADNNDNGIGSGYANVTPVESGQLTMAGGEVAANITISNATGSTTDLTVDFGFVYPYALGNRVWFDTDNSGTINGTEKGANGVTVDLYHATALGALGAYVGTDTTVNGGYYLFDNLTPGDYIVVIPASNFTGVLKGYWSSLTFTQLNGTVNETPASNPNDDLDSDDNGTRQASGDVLSLPVTLGPNGLTEPTGEGDVDVLEGSAPHQGTQPDGRANMTVDFGFYKTEIGNVVFGDGNKNGAYDGTPIDAPLDGVTVRLYNSTGATEIPVGPDGILGFGVDAAGGVTTGPLGHPSWAAGEYWFSGLPEGDYVVKVIAPPGTFSTNDNADLNDTTTTGPDINTDNNDNGQGVTNGTVTAGLLTMTAGSLGAKSNNKVDDVTIGYGVTRNPTVDFGFTAVYALGNRVWYDTNNSSQIDNGEGLNGAVKVGADGVNLQLYMDNGSGTYVNTGLTATTANGGYYLFDGLESGSYRVVIPASNFASGNPLYGYWSSATSRNPATGVLGETPAVSPEPDYDSDDNGTRDISGGALNGAVVSQTVILGPGNTESTAEADVDASAPGADHQGNQPDNQANMTVDFGFYNITLGDQVWNDLDNSGNLNGAEAGIDGVHLELYSANGTQIMLVGPDGLPGTADDVAAGTVTSGGGFYSFTGLPTGDYIVRIPHTDFEGAGTLRDYRSSTGNSTEPAPDADVVFTDSDDNGEETGGVLGLGGYIETKPVTHSPAAEASYSNITGTTAEPRVDFGVFNSPQAELSITKTDGKPIYVPGSTFNYTITVNNTGPSDVTGATVTDTLPPEVTSASWTCSGAGGATCTASGPGAVNDIAANIPLNGSVTYIQTVTVSAAASVDLVNIATVSHPRDTTLANNTATDTDARSTITVTKDDHVTIVAPGASLTYDLVITNTGLVPLTSVTVTDTLPADVTFQNVVVGDLVPTTAPVPGTPGGMLTWTGINLNVGASLTIRVIVNVNAIPAAASITNAVNVLDTITLASANASDVDNIAVSNVKTITDTSEVASGTVQPAPPAPPVPLANPEPVFIGEILTYRIHLDVPVGTMTGLTALDVLDPGLAFVRCVSVTPAATAPATISTNLVGGFTAACNAPATPPTVENPAITAEPVGDPATINQGRRVTFTFGDVTYADANPAGMGTIDVVYEAIVLDVPSNVNGLNTLNNHIEWRWNGTSTLSGEATPVNITEPVLNIAKTANPTVAVYGTPIDFTIDIAHTIPTSTAPAYDVIVADVLPTGLSFVPGSIVVTGLAPTTIDPYNVLTRRLRFVWDVFPVGQTAKITFQATFIGPAPVINESSVEWTSLDLDPNLPPLTGPVQRSIYNIHSTERWYDPTATSPNNYRATSSITIDFPGSGGGGRGKKGNGSSNGMLPSTGFAPDVVTNLPAQPEWLKYTSMDDMWLEIPNLGLKMPITGVPIVNGEWDLTWLSNQAGYLEGTTYPGQVGTSGITGHVTLADGTPGPFRNLEKLAWGDQIILYANGQRYIYELRDIRKVIPSDFSVFKYDGYTWMTLLTCKDYAPLAQTYSYRTAVRAVLVRIEPDSSDSVDTAAQRER